MSDFSRMTHPKSKKERICEWCGQTILSGKVHPHFVGTFQGDWQNWRMHDECYAVMRLGDYIDGFTPHDNERPPP